MRLIAFTDYVYREVDGVIYAERAFALFLAALGDRVEELTILGRLDDGSGPMHYALPPQVRFIALPHYDGPTHPLALVRSLLESVGRFWGGLRRADAAFLLGPSPHSIMFATLAKLRRRRVVLGVRQDYPSYVRNHRPGVRWLHWAADGLELAWLTLARFSPVVTVGPELARRYRHAPSALTISVSLISTDDVDAGERAWRRRDYGGELTILSVGRLDREKNPLLLVEALAHLRAADPRWRLVVCGEGAMADEVRDSLARHGLTEVGELAGYVPIDGGLLELYRSSHVLLHASLTEGMPQVIIEAFASGLPVVATAVGGIPGAVDGNAVLIAPGDTAAAVDAVAAVARDGELRRRLVTGGLATARRQTLSAETERVVAFIEAARRPRGAPSAA